MKPFQLKLPNWQINPNLSLRLRQLDYLPRWLALSAGGAIGLLLAVLLIWTTPLAASIGVILLLASAFALARSGEPISIVLPQPKSAEPDEPAEKPEPEPEPQLLPKMVPIPAGKFIREGHEISISAFECMTTPVTRRLYQAITGNDPGWPEDEDGADERPINNVSWFAAVRFCNELSQHEGLTPCYQFDEDDEEKVSWDQTADGFRLLTDAEWEYACRAGTDTTWYFGNDEEELPKYAWFDKNSENTTHPVGQKLPNAWQLYDMHGNVDEWCWDWYNDYPDEAPRDPSGPASGDRRALRGGAFSSAAWFLRSAGRYWYRPVGVNRLIGFRCARGSRRQP